MSTPALELFEPSEYLNAEKPGYFSLLWKEQAQSGRREAQQRSYDLRNMPQVIKLLNPKVDTWISQAVFTAKNRQAVNLRDVGLIFADLDTYHKDDLRRKSPERQAEMLCNFCRAEDVPEPSIILFSGRGLQAKWLLTEPQARLNVIAWNETQRALVSMLEPFAADVNSKDVSRVLRLDNTVNTKSGKFCRIIHVTGGNENCLARYDFDDLSAALSRFAETIPQRPTTERESSGGGKLVYADFQQPFKAQHQARRLRELNWLRLEDIRRIWQNRGGVPEGYREVTLFWELNFLLLAQPVAIDRIWHEAAALAREISHKEFYRESDLSTLYRKAKESQGGGRIEFQGRMYPPFYTPQNTTLLEIFRVTSDEEQSLRTIISQNEKNRRRREKARAAGSIERAEYESQSLNRLKPWEAEGVSRKTWYKRRAKMTQVQSLSCVGVGDNGRG